MSGNRAYGFLGLPDPKLSGTGQRLASPRG
ncbi:uncharacterized protein METZ01_LOCUS136389 [marine metagenome]|uniref:Uncharacterized protein n=1 Tax=marine metagenome TaxID=408172 RepID=A0A381Z2Q3_9ZZZZ